MQPEEPHGFSRESISEKVYHILIDVAPLAFDALL